MIGRILWGEVLSDVWTPALGFMLLLYKRTSFVGVSAQCPATTKRVETLQQTEVQSDPKIAYFTRLNP